MIIKKMEEHHLDAVLFIEQNSFTHPWSKSSFESELEKDSSYSYIAVENDVVIGYAVMSTVLDQGDLLIIAVDENHRRKGVAKALFDKLCEKAKELSLAYITLEVRSSNISAIKLYESLSFEKVAVRKNYYSTPTEDAVLMTKYF